MPFRLSTAVAVLVLSSGCLSESDARARMSRATARIDAEADAARRCAVDLRALLDRSPGSVGAALAIEDGARDVVDARAAYLPAAQLRDRALARLSRREGSIEASRKLVAAASAVGTAALDPVLAGVEASGTVRRQLCRARDEAVALAGPYEARRLALHASPGGLAGSVAQPFP